MRKIYSPPGDCIEIRRSYREFRIQSHPIMAMLIREKEQDIRTGILITGLPGTGVLEKHPGNTHPCQFQKVPSGLSHNRSPFCIEVSVRIFRMVKQSPAGQDKKKPSDLYS